MKSSFRLARSLLAFTTGLFVCAPVLTAATFSFNTDPFAGSTALTTPGRQVVGGEPSITFTTAADVFSLSTAAFGVSSIAFANDVVGSLSPTGLNTIVLRTFDNDGNAATAFGAGQAADLIAAQVTSPGAGFFIYFNSGLDLARLVYSTDLNDATADLKIVARMTNLSGQPGRDGMATFTAGNFQVNTAAVPETASVLTLVMAIGAVAAGRRWLPRRAG